MSTVECLNGHLASASYMERVRYFPRQLLKASDLEDADKYHREKRRLHNRLLHGWGIVCGLSVEKNPLPGAPLNIAICCGYALSPQGDEILVPAEVQFDLGQCVQGQGAPCRSPCSPVVLGAVEPTKEFYVAIRYIECPSHPVRVPPLGCGCDETACEYSRIRDSFEVSCLVELPTSYSNPPTTEELCHVLANSKFISCPPCPDSPWIVLATVKLDAGALDVKDDVRRLIISVAAIQEHLRIQCA